jgi:spore germination protein
VLFVFTTVVALIYAYSVVGGDMLNHKERKHIIALFLPAMYLVALAGNNVAELFDLIDKLTITLGGYTAMILPIIMFIMMKLKKDKGKNSEQSSKERGEENEA